MSKTIAIDFDGVIHRYSKGWYDGTIYDPPITGAREALQKLKNLGYKVVIFTSRDYSDGEIERYLINNNIPFDEITNQKIPAVFYIDDRAVRFENWKQTLTEIQKSKED